MCVGVIYKSKKKITVLTHYFSGRVRYIRTRYKKNTVLTHYFRRTNKKKMDFPRNKLGAMESNRNAENFRILN